jgi:hypothetical protein
MRVCLDECGQCILQIVIIGYVRSRLIADRDLSLPMKKYTKIIEGCWPASASVRSALRHDEIQARAQRDQPQFGRNRHLYDRVGMGDKPRYHKKLCRIEL